MVALEGAAGSAGRTESTSEYDPLWLWPLPRPEQRTAGVGGRRHVHFASRAPRPRPAAPPGQGAARRRPPRRCRRRRALRPPPPECTATGAVTLAAAQLVIARELGFASWPQLKAAVEAHATTPERLAEVFVAASVEGRVREAATILDTAPDIARYSLEAAAVLGDSEQVRERLAVDPAAAVAIDEVRGWPPLLYACYSRWHQIDPVRAAGMAEVVRLLLDAGASPNTNNGARQRLPLGPEGIRRAEQP